MSKAAVPDRTPVVLGSSSPYRRELLSRLGIPFQVHAPEIDESRVAEETPRDLALRLAVEKARAVSRLFPNAIVIGSDQVAHSGPEIFGKPGTEAKAIAQLQAMSGKTVTFESALCVIDPRTGNHDVDSVPTEITFRALSAREIASYVEREPAFNCAGSAKLEGLGITLISRMRADDPTAIIGLPLVRLCQMLTDAGLRVL